MENNKKFELPEQTLRQLSEFSGGGYVLFRMDSEGQPEVYSNFDNIIVALGLIKFIKGWSQAVNEAQEMSIGAQFFEGMENEEGEEEDG